jgi:hypothetical protein
MNGIPQAEARAAPGSESVPSLHSLPNLDLCQRFLAQLCGSITQTSSMTIYDRTFFPKEFIRMRLATALRHQIWERAWFDQKCERMERPSEIHKHVVRYSRALSMVEEFLGIDIAEMLRAVMLSVVFDPESGKLFDDDQRQQYSVSYLRPPTASEPQSIPKCIGTWLVNLLERVGMNGSIQYSGFFGGLVSGDIIDTPPTPEGHPFRAEEFCDMNEFTAICNLVGSYGVKVIDNELLLYIVGEIEKLKQWLTANQVPLMNFSNGWMTDAIAKRSMGDMQHAATILLSLGVNVGLALAVRVQIHKALAQTLAASCGQLAHCVDVAHLFATNGIRHNQPPAVWSFSRALYIF